MSRETIYLQYPVTVEGETITELHIRRPTVGDLKRVQKHKDDLEKSIHMIANLTEVSPAVVEALDTADFTTVSDKVGEYMGAPAE